jgi:excisionase family DNA binding protein
MDILDCLPDTLPERLSASEVADLLGITVRTVLRLSDQGELPPCVRVSPRRAIFNTDEVRESLRALNEPRKEAARAS